MSRMHDEIGQYLDALYWIYAYVNESFRVYA